MSDVPRLHVIVDSVELADAVLAVGAGPELALQVRLKTGTDRARYEVARAVVDRGRAAGALCLVNDRVDLALAAGADGVHVGADDLPVAVVRQLVPPTFAVGGTARDPETAKRLVREGATYLGVGPTYATRSKDGLPDPLGPEGVRKVAEAVDVPVVAIAGITADRVPDVLDTGAWGVAVISAVADAVDPTAAVTDLLARIHPFSAGFRSHSDVDPAKNGRGGRR